VNFSLDRIRTVARRDYLATVRRKAFLFTLFGTPLLYAVLMLVVIKPQQADRLNQYKSFKGLGVIDSSGLFVRAPAETWIEMLANPFTVGGQRPPERLRFRAGIRRFDAFDAAKAALDSGSVTQVVVIPKDYAEKGTIRRYAKSANLFNTAGERVVNSWMVDGILAGRFDSTWSARISDPLHGETAFTEDRSGQFETHDDAREFLGFLLPFALGLLLGLSIVIGGQYLLQGVSEEKESRILESMLPNVTSEEFLIGKLIGLGGAGLTIVVGWLVLVGSVATPVLGLIRPSLPSGVIVIMIAYFLLGYLFYGSLMMGIGSMASNMREAQQFSVWFTFMNFIPFYMLPTLIEHSDSTLGVALSLIPFTAPVTTMIRLAAPGAEIPWWQIAASMTLLAGSAVVVLMASARVFRVGMLMYGKAPNLPEILRWMRQA
jgi:ABC-2 type transport system permease protein